MTQEEILKKGVPIEPNCFETEREEQWYKVGYTRVQLQTLGILLLMEIYPK